MSDTMSCDCGRPLGHEDEPDCCRCDDVTGMLCGRHPSFGERQAAGRELTDYRDAVHIAQERADATGLVHGMQTYLTGGWAVFPLYPWGQYRLRWPCRVVRPATGL